MMTRRAVAQYEARGTMLGMAGLGWNTEGNQEDSRWEMQHTLFRTQATNNALAG